MSHMYVRIVVCVIVSENRVNDSENEPEEKNRKLLGLAANFTSWPHTFTCDRPPTCTYGRIFLHVIAYFYSVVALLCTIMTV